MPARHWTKRLLVGRKMASHEAEESLLPKRLAMPIFASDPLSSVAYATEAALLVLVGASASSMHLIVPLSIAIAALLAIVVVSYRQTIYAYPSGGGAYVVARDNLGAIAALVAAASLLVDYILTVAVSIVAGVVAVVSAAPSLAPHAVALSIGAVVLLHIANLRGMRESGYAFALPTYGFVLALGVMIALGVGRGLTSGWPHATVPDPIAPGGDALTLFLVLKAFASGCSALTGVEAISNGVTAFRRPQPKNAASALMSMGAIAIALFLGVSTLAWKLDAHPSSSVSILSELARAIFPAGTPLAPGFYAVQAFTFAVLFLAANAAYQGFPRLLALMARDGYVPRQFQNLGDRLVFSNGLAVLSVAAIGLVVAFHASVEGLIHLYLLGVFTAFTLSQVGMVRMWWRRRRTLGTGTTAARMTMNGIGAMATGVVSVMVIITKFADGAWMVTVAVPVIVAGSLLVHHHYGRVQRALDSGYVPQPGGRRGPTVLIVPAIDDATLEALRYAESLVGSDFHAVHVTSTGSSGISRVWRSFHNDYEAGVPDLEVIPKRRTITRTLVEYVRDLPRDPGEFLTVIIPELFDDASVRSLIARRSTLALHLRLLREPGVAVTDVPILAGSPETREALGVTRRMAVVAPISTISDASLRALDYAMSVRSDSARAMYVDLDPVATRELKERWAVRRLPMELQILPSPYRDIGEPLLEEIRARTADPDTVCMVVMPELIVTSLWQRALHNQRALYLKRLLLFEPRVIITSVPLVLEHALAADRRRTPRPSGAGAGLERRRVPAGSRPGRRTPGDR